MIRANAVIYNDLRGMDVPVSLTPDELASVNRIEGNLTRLRRFRARADPAHAGADSGRSRSGPLGRTPVVAPLGLLAVFVLLLFLPSVVANLSSW